MKRPPLYWEGARGIQATHRTRTCISNWDKVQ